MDVTISISLLNIYRESHRNIDMALMTLIDSFDPQAFQKAFDIINPVSLTGDNVNVKIGDTATKQIKEAFEDREIDSNLVSLLLWVAVLFPEI